MEFGSREMAKIEESLKNQLKEQNDRLDRAIQEFREQQSKDMEELRTMFLKLESVISSQSSSSSISNPKSEKECGFSEEIQYILARFEFPKFHGEGLNEWLCKCEMYFDFAETPDDSKVRIASLHLDGRALLWHQCYMRNKGNERVLQWEEYIHALSIRFGEALHYDPMAELKNLEQVGTVQTYLDKFDEILSRLHLPEDLTVSFFLSGLKEEIQYPVRVFTPGNLQLAVRLAKLQELIVENLHKKETVVQEGNSQEIGQNSYNKSGNVCVRSNTNKPIKQLSSREIDEKRSKGLCLWCDERCTPGHECSAKQFYEVEVYMEGNSDAEMEKEDENYTEDNQGNTEVELPMMFVDAFAGVPLLCNYRAMRVSGHIKGQTVQILINSGSTHNFIDVNTVNGLGCTVVSSSPVNVVFANGRKIQCEKTCVGLKWKMQGQEFQADLLVLPLQDCQMVLGIQWLILLGPIIWNFKQLRMEFTVGNKKVVLRGASTPRVQGDEV